MKTGVLTLVILIGLVVVCIDIDKAYADEGAAPGADPAPGTKIKCCMDNACTVAKQKECEHCMVKTTTKDKFEFDCATMVVKSVSHCNGTQTVCVCSKDKCNDKSTVNLDNHFPSSGPRNRNSASCFVIGVAVALFTYKLL